MPVIKIQLELVRQPRIFCLGLQSAERDQNMPASGAALHPDVQPLITQFKKQKQKGNVKIPWIVFILENNDSSELVISVKRVADPTDKLTDLLTELHECEAAYAALQYEASEKADFLVLMYWSKDSTGIKKKMSYSASIAPLKNLCNSFRTYMEVHDESDLSVEELNHKCKYVPIM